MKMSITEMQAKYMEELEEGQRLLDEDRQKKIDYRVRMGLPLICTLDELDATQCE